VKNVNFELVPKVTSLSAGSHIKNSITQIIKNIDAVTFQIIFACLIIMMTLPKFSHPIPIYLFPIKSFPFYTRIDR